MVKLKLAARETSFDDASLFTCIPTPDAVVSKYFQEITKMDKIHPKSEQQIFISILLLFASGGCWGGFDICLAK